jgi:chaperonin GroEL
MKRMLFGLAALKALADGMREVAQLAATTYGPRGSKVMVSRGGKPLVTTDGSALSRELRVRGLDRVGIALSRVAATKVDDLVGDGTTTTLLLASALVDAALDTYSSRDWNPVLMVRDLEGLVPLVVEMVEAMSVPPGVDFLKEVARMTSHGDDLVAEVVTEAVQRVGENGTILVYAGEGVGIEVENRDGLVLDVGWSAHFFGRMNNWAPYVLEGPMVAVVDGKLSSFNDIQTLLEKGSSIQGRNLVLFCRDLVDGAMETVAYNFGEAQCLAVAFRGPDGEGHLGDVAAVTGAHIVDARRGDDLKHFQREWLGSARKITVEKDRTEILSYPDVEEGVAARVRELLRLAETSPHTYDQDRYKERAAALDGGLCILKVGGYTESEARERRSRVEDTLRATQEVLRSGVVPGAGRALHFVSQQPSLTMTPGGRVLKRTLEEPLRVLARKSGVSFGTLSVPDDSPWIGWCPVRGELENFRQPPYVVDPTGVVVNALKAAVSVAVEVLRTEVLVTTTPPIPPRR